jgi:uncharacterized membrane protein
LVPGNNQENIVESFWEYSGPGTGLQGGAGRQGYGGKEDKQMLLIGRLHPLLLHFPIGLVLAAAAAELLAILTRRESWRTLGVANVRAGAAFAAVTAVAGWALTSAPFIEPSRLLEWHRWMGVAGAIAAIGAAVVSTQLRGQSRHRLVIYQAGLFGAAALIGLAGHLGGTLVWGAAFLHP